MDAANDAVGKYVVVKGITKKWVGPKVVQASRQRTAAYRAWLECPGADTERALDQANAVADTASREAMLRRQAEAEDKCVRLWSASPGSRSAYAALSTLAGRSKASPVPMLYHPDTGAVCTSPQAKADALAAQYSPIAAATPPACAAEVDQRANSARQVHIQMSSSAKGPDAISEPFTEAEVSRALGKLRNYRAPGHDGLPAEFLKYSGPAGVTALTNMYNALWEAECIPEDWRKGVTVAVFKADDPTDCNNYRGLTLMPVFDKLFSVLLLSRLSTFVPLHDHQYAFRRSRGTLNALFNLTSAVRSRTEAGLPTFACFFDARKAYDTVDHTALLSRLVDKGVTGKMWRMLAQLYAQARSAVRVDGCVSDEYHVSRGVAQGCPLSPFLYAIYIDSLLDHIHVTCAAHGVHLQADALLRALVGQSYADDLAVLAETSHGLQCIIDAVRSHSERWGWTLNVKKTVILVFGPPASRAAAASCAFYWGTDALPRCSSVRYLGLHLHEDGSWTEHIAAATRKGWAAYHSWAPVLASSRIRVALKIRIINTFIRPVMEYAMEIWGVGLRKRDATALAPLDDVVQAACRLACGIHASRTEKSWQRRAGVTPAVMYTAARLLPMIDVMDVAHVRFAERMRRADDYAKLRAVHDVAASAALDPLAANIAPDFMGAAVRTSLQAGDMWCARVRKARKTILKYVPDAEKQYLSNMEIRQATHCARVVRRAREVAAAPVEPGESAHGRTLHRVRPASDHFNPVSKVLSVECPSPCFLRCPDAIVLTLLMLRSAHVPGDYSSYCVNTCFKCLSGVPKCSTCYTNCICVRSHCASCSC